MSDSYSVQSQLTSSSAHAVYSVLRFLRVVRHRKSVIFTTLIIAGLLGAIYFATAERVYRADTSLQVLFSQPESPNDSMTQGVHGQFMMPTYERLFFSSVVLQGAIDALDELPAEARVDLAPFPRDKWLEELRHRLTARAVRATNIIEISYVSEHPRTAATVVSAVVQSYDEYIDRTNGGAASEIAKLLEVHVRKFEDQLKAKNEELLVEKRKWRDLDIDDASIVHPVLRKLDRTHADLVEVEQKRISLQATLIALKRAIERGGNLQQYLLKLEPAVGRTVILATLGLSSKDAEVMARLEQELAEDRARLEQLAEFFLENHAQMRWLTSRVNRLGQEIVNYRARQANIVSASYNQQLGELLLQLVTEDLQQTWTQEQALRQEYQQAEQMALQWTDGKERIQVLERQEERIRALDTALRTRLANIDIKTDQADVRVAVVSEAFADSRPISPKLLWVLFVCGAGGTLVGAGVVYVMDVLDDRFRSPEELREQLGAAVLAMVRQLPVREENGVAALQVHTAPDSIESEAFRTLRTTVAFSGDELDCLAISSAEQGDGKTTVLSNFGVATAQSARRTLLIDADMRRPGLSKLFDVRGQKGLGDLLSNETDLRSMVASLVRPTGAKNLDLLPAGIRPSDPTGLLSGPRFAELLSWAQANYDQVLIDTPPILAASDATIIGRLVDGLILVVQPEKNHRRLVLRAAEEIRSAKLNFVGIVANRVGQNAGNEYYTSGYGYGYSGHGYDEDEHDSRTDELIEPPLDTAGTRLTQPRRAA